VPSSNIMKRNSSLILNHILWRGFYFFSVLLLNICIARFFAAEKSGQIFYIVNNLSLILLGVSLSLESGTIYFISSGKLNAIEMGRFCILWTLVASALAFGIWRLPFVLNPDRLQDSHLSLAVLLFITGVLLTSFFSALHYSKQQFALPNKLLLIINAAFILFLMAGHNFNWVRGNFMLLYFSSFFIQGILLLISFFINVHEENKKGFPPWSVLKITLQYSLIALSGNLIYFLVKRMDYWFVKKYCSANDLGNYIQASKLGQLLMVIPSILGTTLFALVAAGENNNIKKVVRVLLWINIIISGFLALTGYWLFPFLFGKSFQSMYVIFLLLIPGLLCLTANFPLAAFNSGNNLLKRNIAGSFFALLSIMAGDYFILPRLGVWSAALISSIGYIVYFIYILLLYRKDHMFRASDFLIIRKTDITRLLTPLKNFSGRSTIPEEIKFP
jgi:O-antigen/teichoic acid export membrane protein